MQAMSQVVLQSALLIGRTVCISEGVRYCGNTYIMYMSHVKLSCQLSLHAYPHES